MTTAAKPTTSESAHWYSKDGQPCHFVEKKDGIGSRRSTLADARKNLWLPSVTTVLGILDKPALTNWKIEQAVLAVITTPRQPGEADDAFIQRVLHTEKQQDQEGQKARDLGTEIHDAIEQALSGTLIPAMQQYVDPVLAECAKFGEVKATEQIVIGEGYAGKMDASFYAPGCLTIVDFKTTSKPPKKEKGSWSEHRLQLSAYAKAHPPQRIQTANIYISTKEPGLVVPIINPPWEEDYPAFEALLTAWKWMNNYDPTKEQP